MQILWDQIEGGRVQVGAGVLSVDRAALVTDIPASDLSDSYVLLRAMDLALSTAGQFAPGTGGRGFLSGLVVSPAKGTNQARIIATYTAPQNDPGSGGQAVRWVLEDASSLSSEHTELDPFNEPLHTDYTAPAAGAAGPIGGGGFAGLISTGPPQSIPYPFSSNVLRPRRIISIEGYTVGRPRAVLLDALGCVNKIPWPTSTLFRDEKPKRRGTWLCSGVSATVERPGIVPQAVASNLYRVSARFTTRGKYPEKRGQLSGDRDWSDYGVHKNLLGRIPADMLEDDQVQKMFALMKREYKVGQILPDDDGGVNGYCKVGNYPIYDFKSAFGL